MAAVTIWSYLPGEGRWVFPDNVGWKVGPGTGQGNDNEFAFAILEQHYDNPQRLHQSTLDNSGARLWFSDKPRKYTPSLLSVADPFASTNLLLPPHSKNYEARFLCPKECTRKFPHPIHIFMGAQHMHMNGQRMVTQVRRKGTNALETIDYNNWFQHNMQRQTNLNVTIYPGDEVITYCTYSNDNPVPVRMGANTYNEMCMQLLAYYPRMSTWMCGYKDQTNLWCGGVTDIMSVKLDGGRKLQRIYAHDTSPRKWGQKQPQCMAQK